MIVLNGPDTLKDFLDKSSGTYSGRLAVFIREFGDDVSILMRKYVLQRFPFKETPLKSTQQ